jgi:hypothetical protein
VNYSPYREQITGLATIGDGRGYGYLLHSVLAVVPVPRTVVGVLYQSPFLRQPAPKGETSSQRLKRERESQAWPRAATAIGPPPADTTWVHVGDCGSDLFPFFAAIRQTGAQFVIRAYQDRRLETPEVAYLRTTCRQLPAVATRPLLLSARHGRPARSLQLSLAYCTVVLRPPRHDPGYAPMTVSVIRAWDPDSLATDEPVEWMLLSSLPVQTVAAAWERVAWYTCRWVVEEFHQCLKTGCRIEQRRLATRERLWRLLALCTPIAVRLLQLREGERTDPDRPASACLPAAVVDVLARRCQVPLAQITTGLALREIAQLGGYLGRTGDGPPGWKTLWRGWEQVSLLADGLHLASRPPPTSV